MGLCRSELAREKPKPPSNPHLNFIPKLRKAWEDNNSLVCVGLDPDPARFPGELKNRTDKIFAFNKAIIDATHDLVCAFKPQFAHYASCAAEDQLEQTISYIHDNYPDVPVILDSKRGDIGSTAEHYAEEAFERYTADAVTVNPYLGKDSVQPFLDYANKGVLVLCRNSNPGSAEFQNLSLEGLPLYQHVASKVANKWNDNGNCLLVAGATYPEELGEIRKLVDDMPILVPGIGAQGGDVAAIVKNGCTADGTGLIISSSRAVLYASSDDDFAQAAHDVTVKLRDEINAHRVLRKRFLVNQS